MAAIPDHLWHEAEKQAMRSSLKQFRTGAIIFNEKFQVVAKGCSHHNDSQYVHAEQHAISNLGQCTNPGKLSVLVVTIGKANNWAWSSKPCVKCANLLHKRGLGKVVYAERDKYEQWTLNIESVSNLFERCKHLSPAQVYAKKMRIP